jgi:hypothetical protein
VKNRVYLVWTHKEVSKFHSELYMTQQEQFDGIPPFLPKPVKWIIPDSIRTDHATHLVVQQQGSELILLFFEVRTPLFVGTPEEQLAAMQAIESVEATCIARIVLSIENVPAAVINFQQGWELAMKQISKGQENVPAALANFQQSWELAMKQTLKGQENVNNPTSTELPTNG